MVDFFQPKSKEEQKMERKQKLTKIKALSSNLRSEKMVLPWDVIKQIHSSVAIPNLKKVEDQNCDSVFDFAYTSKDNDNVLDLFGNIKKKTGFYN